MKYSTQMLGFQITINKTTPKSMSNYNLKYISHSQTTITRPNNGLASELFDICVYYINAGEKGEDLTQSGAVYRSPYQTSNIGKDGLKRAEEVLVKCCSIEASELPQLLVKLIKEDLKSSRTLRKLLTKKYVDDFGSAYFKEIYAFIKKYLSTNELYFVEVENLLYYFVGLSDKELNYHVTSLNVAGLHYQSYIGKKLSAIPFLDEERPLQNPFITKLYDTIKIYICRNARYENIHTFVHVLLHRENTQVAVDLLEEVRLFAGDNLSAFLEAKIKALPDESPIFRVDLIRVYLNNKALTPFTRQVFNTALSYLNAARTNEGIGKDGIKRARTFLFNTFNMNDNQLKAHIEQVIQTNALGSSKVFKTRIIEAYTNHHGPLATKEAPKPSSSWATTFRNTINHFSPFNLEDETKPERNHGFEL